MGILTMLGLMRVEDHNKAIQAQDAVLRAKNITINDLSATVEKRRVEYASLNRDYGIRGDLLAKARAEAASLRPDAEWARARKAKAAEYEANRRVRKAKGAG